MTRPDRTFTATLLLPHRVEPCCYEQRHIVCSGVLDPETFRAEQGWDAECVGRKYWPNVTMSTARRRRQPDLIEAPLERIERALRWLRDHRRVPARVVWAVIDGVRQHVCA